MREEIINKIRLEYEKNKKARERSLKVIFKMKELESDSKVQEYLKLKKLIEDYKIEQKINQTDSDIIETVFYENKNNIKETNKIYVYLGTFIKSNEYDIIHKPNDIKVKYDDSKAQYRIYMDLENGEEKQINIEECEKFENENNIVFPNSVNNMSYYYQLQKEFINDIIIDGQKRACERILTKVKK